MKIRPLQDRVVVKRLEGEKVTKGGIIKLGVSLGVDYAQTTSCYDPSPDGKPCGKCDSCRLRLKGFGEALLVKFSPQPSKALHEQRRGPFDLQPLHISGSWPDSRPNFGGSPSPSTS